MSLHDLVRCECGQPRHRHQEGDIEHPFVDGQIETDRQFVARLKHLDLPVLEALLSTVPHEWQWICVDRELRRRGARK
jgi:hypothetical protein